MLNSFSQADTRGRHVNIYYCGNISFGHGWRIAIVSLWRPGCPAPSNKREAAGACHIQIKICAEYRDMLPRPRLVCQEPGLRPIGRSPGVPDKSSRGLGSMSRYSAQILICFIAYIFLFFFLSSVGLVGNCAGLPVCTVPSAIVHCNQNEAGHQTIKAPSMPCWDAAGPSKHSLAFKSQPGENDR